MKKRGKIISGIGISLLLVSVVTGDVLVKKYYNLMKA